MAYRVSDIRTLKVDLTVGEGACEGDYGTLIDLFSQGMALTVEITLEVKFFEVKIEEFAAGRELKIKHLKELFDKVSSDWMDNSESTVSADEVSADEVSDSSG